MKNIFSSFLFLLVSNLVSGQIEWVGNHSFSETATDLVRTSQNQYILVHNGLTVFDSIGNIVFSGLTNDYPDADGVFFSDIIELSDSSIVFSAEWAECDVLVSIVVKYDKNWNQLWSNYHNWVSGPAAKFNNNSFIVAEGNSIEKWDSDGAQLWEKFLSGYDIKDVVVLPNETVLLPTDKGLLIMSSNGVLMDSIPDLVLDHLDLLPNGNFLAKAYGTLYLYSQSFTQLSTYPIQGMTIEDITFKPDGIAVVTSDNHIFRFNQYLTFLGFFQLPSQKQQFKTIVYSTNGLMAGGSEQFGNLQNKNQSAFIKEYALDGSTINTSENVALISVNQTSSLTVASTFGLFTITIPDIDMVVKNLGTTAVESVTVNFMWPDAGGFPCPFNNTFSKQFDNLALQPGSSATIDWGDLSIRTWTDFSGEQIELCFWTSLPNHHLETNNANDVSCTEVLVAAHEPFPITFYHAFNAVTDMLYLEMKSQLDAANANVFNAAGQLVYKAPIDWQFQNLDLSGLPDGAYFLQIVSGERVGWGKFAKY